MGSKKNERERGMPMRLHPILIIVSLAASLYTPVELTRVIVLGGMKYYPFMVTLLVWEIVLIWLSWLTLVMVIIALSPRKRGR